jgi:acetolactate synthase small subunit
MTDEDRQRTMDFILEQQAQFSINIESLREAQARTDAAIAQLTTQVQSIARQQEQINEVVAVIADAQQHTDERLNALIDVVEKGRNGQT